MSKFNIQIDGKLKSTTKGNEIWWYGGGAEAWSSLANAKAGVPLAIRSGKTVGVLEDNKIVEYIWYPNDTSDSGLVLKQDALPDNVAFTDIDNDFTANQTFKEAIFDRAFSNNEATSNNELVRLDQLNSAVSGLNWQDAVDDILDFTINEPTSPTIGDRYINSSNGTSSGTGQSVTKNNIYEWDGTDWAEFTPLDGWTVFDRAVDQNFTFNGTSWVEFGSTVSHNNTTGLQGGQAGQYYHLTEAQYLALSGGIDAATLNGQNGAYYLNYNNFSNVPDLSGFLVAADLNPYAKLNGGNEFSGNQTIIGTISANNLSGTNTGNETKASIDALRVDAATLQGQNGSYYLDYNNFSNKPTIDNYGYFQLQTNSVNRKQIASENILNFLNGFGISVTYGSNGAVTISNTITNNNQLTNGAGYVTSSGNTVIGTDDDINTSGAQVIDTLVMTDGVIMSHTVRTLTLANLGFTGDSNANRITNNSQISNGAGYITSAGNTQLSKEQVEDYVGLMVQNNVETNISVTYDDSRNKLNFASVNTQLSNAQVTAITNPLYAKLQGGNSFSGNQTISGDVDTSGIIYAKSADSYGLSIERNLTDNSNTTIRFLQKDYTSYLGVNNDGSFAFGVSPNLAISLFSVKRNGNAIFSGDVNAEKGIFTNTHPQVTYFEPYLEINQLGSVSNSKSGISFRNTQYNWDMGKISTERNNTSNSFDMVFYTSESGNDSEAMRLGYQGNATFSGKVEIDGGVGVSTDGTLVVRQNGDTVNNGISITSSNSTSHRLWKDASGSFNIGTSSQTKEISLGLDGNTTFSGNVGIGGIINADSNGSYGLSIQRSTTNNSNTGLRFLQKDFISYLGVDSSGSLTWGTNPDFGSEDTFKIDVNGNAIFSGDVEVANTNGGIINLKSTDTSIGLDQLIGGLTFEKNDASGEGVGVVGGIKMLSNSSIGASVKMEFTVGINDEPSLIMYENSSQFSGNVDVNGNANFSGNVDLIGDTPILNIRATNESISELRLSDNEGITTQFSSFRFNTSNSDLKIFIKEKEVLGFKENGNAIFSGEVEIDGGNLGQVLGDRKTRVLLDAGRQNVRFESIRTANGSDWNNTTFRILAEIDTTSHQSINFVNDGGYQEHIDIYTGNQIFNTRFTSAGNVEFGGNATFSGDVEVGGNIKLINDTALIFSHSTQSKNISFSNNGTNTLESSGKIQASGYKSSDGSEGKTQVIYTENNTITIKNGIITNIGGLP